MTREEREDAINFFKNKLGNEVYWSKYNKLAIEALEQESISETDIILTREEYGELVSSEYDNGYAKGYREALEQEPHSFEWCTDCKEYDQEKQGIQGLSHRKVREYDNIRTLPIDGEIGKERKRLFHE